MKPLIISQVKAREIIDSRGNPTIEADVILMDGTIGRGASPSGASTGEDEAYELRDNDKARYSGKGVLKAVENVNTLIDKALLDRNAADIYGIDEIMKELDGTENKKQIGANAILAVSIAACRASAEALDMPLYKFLGEGKGNQLPLPMMNILNGGAHADNSLDTQEFMIVPIGADSFSEALRWCTQVYHSLKYTLKCSGFITSVGDEGGFAPNLNSDEEAIELIISSIKEAGFKPGQDFAIAIDAAASEWKNGEKGKYKKPKSGRKFTTAELIKYWKNLCDKYPIYSLEDPLDEDDWEGWKDITTELGNRVQIVGDDLFVTNTKKLKRGIEEGCANSILIKPNQIGSISETIDAVLMAKEAGYTTIISHRSGETEDTFIADLAVALNAGQIKSGAPSRTERVAKYNQLLRIEEELGESCIYKKIKL